MSGTVGPPPPPRPPAGGQPPPPGGGPKPTPGVPGVPALDQSASWTAYIKPALWTITALYVSLFVFFNTNHVTINFIFAKTQIPLIFILIGMAAIGAGLYAGITAVTRRRAQKTGPAAGKTK
jgi:uncharacterized integral membrane protein